MIIDVWCNPLVYLLFSCVFVYIWFNFSCICFQNAVCVALQEGFCWFNFVSFHFFFIYLIFLVACGIGNLWHQLPGNRQIAVSTRQFLFVLHRRNRSESSTKTNSARVVVG